MLRNFHQELFLFVKLILVNPWQGSKYLQLQLLALFFGGWVVLRAMLGVRLWPRPNQTLHSNNRSNQCLLYTLDSLVGQTAFNVEITKHFTFVTYQINEC